MLLYALSNDLIHWKGSFMVKELIGLDRMCLTVKKEDLLMYNDNCINEFNETERAIKIEPSVLNEDLYDVRITAPKLYAHTNEKNVTGNLLNDLVNVINERLELYGIMYDITNANLGSFEINVNINDIQLYYVLKLIAKANINDNFKAFYVENKDGIQSVKINRTEYLVKVYKKSEHLQEQFQQVEQDHLVRFEVSTNRTKEKAKILGNETTLQSLVENWDNVVAWYCRCINLSIKKPIEKYMKDIEKQVIVMLEAGLKPRQIIDLMMFREDLIDLLTIENAIRKYYKKSKHKHANRDIKAIHNRLLKLDEERYQQVKNNIEKFQELYDLIGI